MVSGISFGFWAVRVVRVYLTVLFLHGWKHLNQFIPPPCVLSSCQHSCLIKTSTCERLDEDEYKNTTRFESVPVKRTLTHEHTVLGSIPPAEWKGSLCAVKHLCESLFPPGFIAVETSIQSDICRYKLTERDTLLWQYRRQLAYIL